MNEDQNNIIIYNTDDGLSSVVLVSSEGMVWLSQMQMAKLFATSKQAVSYHISNILRANELTKHSVIKEILTADANLSMHWRLIDKICWSLRRWKKASNKFSLLYR